MTPWTGIADIQVVSVGLIGEFAFANPPVEVVRRSFVGATLVLWSEFRHHSLPCKLPAFFGRLDDSPLRYYLGGRFQQVEPFVEITATTTERPKGMRWEEEEEIEKDGGKQHVQGKTKLFRDIYGAFHFSLWRCAQA